MESRAALQFLAKFFERFLPLDLVHDQESVHLVLDLLLVDPELVQFEFSVLIPRLLELVVTFDKF